MKNTTWVVVANSSYARIFHLKTMSELKELKTLIHPESRLHEKDLVSSRPGVAVESASGSPHPIEPHSTQKETDIKLFAERVLDFLNHSHNDAAFSRLYLVAGPSFLGLLRKGIKGKLQQATVKEINKDIVHMSPKDIIDHVIG